MTDFDRLVGAVAVLELDPDMPRGELKMAVIYRHRDGQDTTLATKTEIDRSHHHTKNTATPENGMPPTYKDMYAVAEEFGEVLKQHPFVKLSQCKSPIEQSFYLEALSKIEGLEPQVEVGQYTVDFAIRRKMVAIELYGYEFHHTRDQLTYDTKRERQLKKWGWEVIPLTGRAIYRDLVGCIEEAKEIIENRPDVDW